MTDNNRIHSRQLAFVPTSRKYCRNISSFSTIVISTTRYDGIRATSCVAAAGCGYPLTLRYYGMMAVRRYGVPGTGHWCVCLVLVSMDVVCSLNKSCIVPRRCNRARADYSPFFGSRGGYSSSRCNNRSCSFICPFSTVPCEPPSTIVD